MKKFFLTATVLFGLINFLNPQTRLDGNISEDALAIPLGTSVSGTIHSFSTGYEINSFFPSTDGTVNISIDTLPLQFLVVNSRIIEDHSFILWSIADDTEVDYYEVEESNTGSVFHNLKSISSQQNNFKTDYIVEDNMLNIGNNYYRVKAVGKNGDITYSKILKMPYGKIDNTLFIYPNPVKQTLKVQLHSLLKGFYKLHIYNDGGQEIYSRSLPHDGLDKTITIQLSPNLAKGIYRLMFINKYEFYKQTFTIE